MLLQINLFPRHFPILKCHKNIQDKQFKFYQKHFDEKRTL